MSKNGFLKGSNSHSIGRTKYTINKIIVIDIKFINTPTLTISDIFKYPDPKTTAFGGVATGNINAHEAAIVAPTISI